MPSLIAGGTVTSHVTTGGGNLIFPVLCLLLPIPVLFLVVDTVAERSART